MFKRVNVLLILLFVACCMLFGGVLIIQSTQARELSDELQSSMNAMLHTTHNAMTQWQQSNRRFIELIASQAQLMRMVHDLRVQRSSDVSPSNLTSNIHRWIYPFYHSQGYQNFFIINQDGVTLASASAEQIGQPHGLKTEPLLLQRAFKGETVLSGPMPMTAASQVRAQSFLLTPIYDSRGNISELLALQIDLQQSLSPLLTQSLWQDADEFFLFNQQGYLVTPSRYQTDEWDKESIPSQAVSVFKFKSTWPELSSIQNPNQAAISVMTQCYLESYLNYRQHRVIGCWLWDPKLNMGLAFEVEQKQALHQFISLQRLNYAVIAASILLLLGFVFIAQRRYERQQQQSHMQLQQLNQAHSLLATLLNNMPDILFLTDQHGVIQWCNQAALDFVQRENSAVLGQRYEHIFPAMNANPCDLMPIIHEKQLIKQEVWLKNARNQRYLFAITRLRADDATGRTQGILHIQHDITNKRQTELQLLAAKEAAEQAGAAKSSFVANMSHELRTPMNAIIGMTELCLQTSLNTKQRDYLQKVQTASNALLSIINDILDFSKMEAGKMELESIQFSVDEILDDLSHLFAWKMREQGIELIVKVAPNLPSHLIGDPHRIKQILINFCSNALKFTEKGEIVISIEPIQQDGKRIRVRFAVIDTGIGLSEHQQATLFSAFTQADTSVTRKYGGTGLGLAISKRLTELMQGSIGVQSQVGQGSQFFFDIPLVCYDSPHAPHEMMPAMQPLQLKRILVIEDNSSAAEIIRALLRPYSDHITVAASAEEAIVLLHKEDHYDLLMVDILLPGRSGIDLVNLLEQQQLCADSAILLMSASISEVSHDVLQQKTIKGFIEKPIRPQLLDRTLRQIFQPVAESTPPPPVEQEILADFSAHEFKILLVEDNPINQIVASEMLEKVGLSPVIANDGDEALEAIAAIDFDLVLMDLQMPKLDGYATTRRIRHQLHKTDLPIIAMTASALTSDRNKCFEAGMNDHVSKPVTLRELSAVLQKWLDTTKAP